MKRKYTFNETFFDSIDTEEKAYILGFLFADGYNNEKRGVVSLSLQESDVEILHKISESIGNNLPLQFIDMKKYHKGKSHHNQYRLSLYSRYTSTILSKAGCYQSKSYSCTFPLIVPTSLLRHFIRGYFDGDGCISYTNNKLNRPCGSVSFIGSSNMCHSTKKCLTALGIYSKVSYSKKYNKKIRRLAFGGRNQLIKFYDYIYKDSTIYLTRKKSKFDEFIRLSGIHLVKNKSTNVYENVKGCKMPFRVVKTLNYKTITIGSFMTRDEAEVASLEWDLNHDRSVVLL